MEVDTKKHNDRQESQGGSNATGERSFRHHFGVTAT